MLQYKIVVSSIYSVRAQDLYLSVVVVLCHTVLLVNKEGMEDVEMEEGGPSRQHQSVLTNIKNQRATRRLHRRQVHRADTELLYMHLYMMYCLRCDDLDMTVCLEVANIC